MLKIFGQHSVCRREWETNTGETREEDKIRKNVRDKNTKKSRPSDRI
jgi:hypothetical protein